MHEAARRAWNTNPREITGYLTEVNLRHGFGFIETDDGTRVYVHSSAFQAAQIEFIRIGQLIHCEALRRDDGWHAIHILSVGANQKQMSGKLVEKPTAVDFGSIEADDGVRVLVTASVFKDSGFSWYEEGHGYSFTAIEGRHGLQVTRIHARTSTGKE
jgi:cold shock CspA family protein